MADLGKGLFYWKKIPPPLLIWTNKVTFTLRVPIFFSMKRPFFTSLPLHSSPAFEYMWIRHRKSQFFSCLFFTCSYEVMTKCWQSSANERPKFSELCMVLDTLVTRETTCWKLTRILASTWRSLFSWSQSALPFQPRSQGLLSTSHHFEKREDPGNEVASFRFNTSQNHVDLILKLNHCEQSIVFPQILGASVNVISERF